MGHIGIHLIFAPVAALIVNQGVVSFQTAQHHLTGNIVYTVKLSKTGKTIPLKSYGRGIGVLRRRRKAKGNVVVGIDDSVAVEINDVIIAGQFLIVVGIMWGTCIEFVPGIDVTITHMRTGLSQHIAHLLLVSG